MHFSIMQVGNVPQLNATQFFDGLVTLVDPALFSDTSAKIRASAASAVISATGKRCHECRGGQDM